MNIIKKVIGNEQGVSKAGVVLILPFVLLVAAYAIYRLFLIPDPVVTGIEGFRFLPAEKTIQINGENLESISIYIMQDTLIKELLSDKPETGEKAYTLAIKPAELGLSDGSAKIFIHAKSGILKEIKQEINVMIDTVPPALEVLWSPFQINQGSGGFAVLRARGSDSVYIKLGDSEFKAFRSSSSEVSQPGPADEFGYDPKILERKKKSSASNYYAFFAAPFDVDKDGVFYAIASDKAGNRSVRALRTRLKTKKFRTSSINISNSFINTVVAPLLNITEIDDPAGAFKIVNEEWREAVLLKLSDITRQTEPEILWKGRFLQLKNSKVMAEYGDIRTYLYKGAEISMSAHLGYDLASRANAPVEASNAGVVRYAGQLSIYGNTIILDHGMGLMTLYGHLSMIAVEEDQRVSKGTIIGRSGSTGLAGGDHLHFGVLIQGYEVSPLYWWDSNWVKVNIEDHLNH